MKKIFILFYLIFTVINVQAENTTIGTNKATAKIATSCQIYANSVSFGMYDPNDANGSYATGSIGVKCTRGTAYVLGADSMRQHVVLETCG